jgi:hypothetical protein
MVILRLHGGLGNQMFQYAMARTVALRRGTSVKIDLRALEADRKRCYSLGSWNVNATLASNIDVLRIRVAWKLYRVLKRSGPYYARPLVREQYHHYDPNALDAPRSCLLMGYWESERYFKEIEPVIRREFTLRTEPSSATQEIGRAIQSSNSVFVHIRRGDRVADHEPNETYGVCSMQYYERAAAHIARAVDSPHFFVFSDEPQWARENFVLPFPITVVDHNRPGNSQTPGSEHEDLWLMGLCRHAIIANSTFSWWGAWLNPARARIVIAPKQWSKYNPVDVIPENWIRI